MSFNPKKCYVLPVTHNTRKRIISPYKLHSIELEVKEHNTYLGVELDDKLNWNHHISQKTKKASQQLNFVRRNLHRCPQNTKEHAYMALVRPHLEYSSTVWDPNWKIDINMIEMIQNRTARFVTNNYNYNPGSMTSIMNTLDWPTLETRRTVNRLIIFHKIIYHQTATEIPQYYLVTNRKTRHSHSANIMQPRCNTSAYEYSFYPRTIRDWNKLPDNIVTDTDSDTFKGNLWSHFHLKTRDQTTQ